MKGTKDERITHLEKEVARLEEIVTGFRGRMLSLAEAGQNLAKLQALNQPILDRLVRVAIYYEVGHDCPTEQTLESYTIEAVEAYIARAGKAFVERVRVRSEQARPVVSHHGIRGSELHRSKAHRANIASDEADGEPETSTNVGRILPLRQPDEANS